MDAGNYPPCTVYTVQEFLIHFLFSFFFFLLRLFYNSPFTPSTGDKITDFVDGQPTPMDEAAYERLMHNQI